MKSSGFRFNLVFAFLAIVFAGNNSFATDCDLLTQTGSLPLPKRVAEKIAPYLYSEILLTTHYQKSLTGFDVEHGQITFLIPESKVAVKLNPVRSELLKRYLWDISKGKFTFEMSDEILALSRSRTSPLSEHLRAVLLNPSMAAQLLDREFQIAEYTLKVLQRYFRSRNPESVILSEDTVKYMRAFEETWGLQISPNDSELQRNLLIAAIVIANGNSDLGPLEKLRGISRQFRPHR